MLRTKPKTKYCGLTVVLSNPSRFDKLSLLTADGGVLFNQYCLAPEYNIMQCDIRLMEDKSPWLDGTKCILLCGEAAMHEYTNSQTGNNTLNEMRGSPLYIAGIPAIATFFPQDGADLKSYEQELNEDSKEFNSEEDSEEDENESDVKSHSRTKRGNYAFWIKSDVRKCKEILRTGSRIWPIEEEPIYKIYPSADEVIEALRGHKDETLYFDIETDIEEQHLLCFSYSFNGRTIYSVPILNHEYKPSYSSYHYIIRSLVRAIKENILIAHNGAAFDFLVLAYKYNIPVYRCYDTMIAMHRCFPDLEVSLGHCISYWTYQKFHKDTDSIAYRTQEHLMAKLKYCAKDVFTLALIHKAIEKYAKTIPGLADSIKCANDSIVPYLTCTMQGIRYSNAKVQEVIKENDRLMMQYVRVIEILIGPTGMQECQAAVKSKAKLFPGSNAQCCSYFHDQLEYPVVMRSTITGKPALGKGSMYKLALKHNNPVITFTMLYRQLQKETGSLEFNPWKDDNNKILPRRKEILDEK